MFLEPSVMFINSCNVHIHLYTKVGAMYISMTVCIRETKQNTTSTCMIHTTHYTQCFLSVGLVYVRERPLTYIVHITHIHSITFT